MKQSWEILRRKINKKKPSDNLVENLSIISSFQLKCIEHVFQSLVVLGKQ